MAAAASGGGKAVEESRVDGDAVAGEGLLLDRPVAAADDLDDGEAVGACEGVVAFVVGGHGHDGAGAVAHEDVVGDPDGDSRAAYGVGGAGAGWNACLFLGEVGACQVGLTGGFADVGLDGGALSRGGDLGDERMFRRQHAVGGAHERVGACGEDREPEGRAAGGAVDLEDDVGSDGSSDPVALHFLDALGPVQVVEVVEEAFRVVGDPEHPLAHRSALDGIAGFHVAAVFDLLVGEDGGEGGAPVDGDVGEVGEALLVEFEEDPLGPAVVGEIGGADLSIPVVAESEAFDLPAEVVDVAPGDLGRVDILAHGGAFGGQAEGVPAHGVQDVVALHSFVAAEDIGGGVALGVADVQTRAGRVGEHVEDVELRFIGEVFGAEGAVGLPVRLPLRLDFAERVLALDLGFHGRGEV